MIRYKIVVLFCVLTIPCLLLAQKDDLVRLSQDISIYLPPTHTLEQDTNKLDYRILHYHETGYNVGNEPTAFIHEYFLERSRVSLSLAKTRCLKNLEEDLLEKPENLEELIYKYFLEEYFNGQYSSYRKKVHTVKKGIWQGFYYMDLKVTTFLRGASNEPHCLGEFFRFVYIDGWVLFVSVYNNEQYKTVCKAQQKLCKRDFKEVLESICIRCEE